MRTVKEHVIAKRVTLKSYSEHDAESRHVLYTDSWDEPIDRVECADGFSMSVQHSRRHYCEPKVNRAEDRGMDFISYEVGFPSEKVEEFMPYAEDSCNPCETVYAYVPADIVEAVAAAHGGVI